MSDGILYSNINIRMVTAVQHRHIIRNYLGVSVSEGMSCVAIIQTLLSKLGLNLTYVGRFGARGERERVYEFIAPKDGRGEVFTKWFDRAIA